MFNQNHANNGKVAARIYDAGCNVVSAVNSVSAINNTKWHHIVFQRGENGLMELYVDAVLEDSAMDQSSCNTTNTENIHFGLRSPNQLSSRRPFTGSLDEIRFYDRPLNQAEVDVLANKTLVSTGGIVDEEGLKIFPNPVPRCKINVHLASKKIVDLPIFNRQGQQVGQVIDNRLPNLIPGLYFLRITTEGGGQIVKRIIVKGCLERA